jgi:ribose-phosphate pyrophosphokinase
MNSLKRYRLPKFLNVILKYESVGLFENISVISGPSSTELAHNIANNLNVDLIDTDLCIFSDGESRIRLPSLQKKDWIVVQSTYPPPDQHLLQALMMINKCSEYRVKNIIAVIPYLAYARQDKEFLPGEVVSLALVSRLLETVGTTQLVTVDIHSLDALSYFRISVQNTSPVSLFAEYAKNRLHLKDPIVVSPDKGGIGRAAELAGILKTVMIGLKKNRDRETGQVVISEEKTDYQIDGNDIIIVDDIISSGSSIIKACEFLKQSNPGEIYVMCTHALMLGDADKEIKAAGAKDIIATNSVPSKYSSVDLSPVICSSIRTLSNKT